MYCIVWIGKLWAVSSTALILSSGKSSHSDPETDIQYHTLPSIIQLCVVSCETSRGTCVGERVLPMDYI